MISSNIVLNITVQYRVRSISIMSFERKSRKKQFDVLQIFVSFPGRDAALRMNPIRIINRITFETVIIINIDFFSRYQLFLNHQTCFFAHPNCGIDESDEERSRLLSNCRFIKRLKAMATYQLAKAADSIDRFTNPFPFRWMPLADLTSH